jgi:hypothetical protein
MRRPPIERTRALGTRLLAGALVAALALALAVAHSRADDSVLTSSRGGAFTIRGHVLGLYPGGKTRLTLTIRNRNAFAIKVRSIRVKVANASGCSRSNVVVRRFRGSLRVAAGKTRRLRLPISMRRAAPDACMGARFPLRYTGKAVKG